MIKSVILTIILMVASSPPQIITKPMPNLDECVRSGIEFMLAEVDELNKSGLPYKQGFLCEEHIIPTH